MTKTQLRVRNPDRLNHSVLTESAFEAKIAKILEEQGVFSYHVSERMYMGIPDRYVAGGRWIEFKQVAMVKAITPIRVFRSSQIRFMDKFFASGDKPYVCVMFQFSRKKPLAILEPWAIFKEEAGKPWTFEKVDEIGYPEEKWGDMILDRLL